jgi:hypothetical protein
MLTGIGASPYSTFAYASRPGQPVGQPNRVAAVGQAAGADPSAPAGSGGCRTCAERKYQDVSDDSSVSFQVPTSVAPGQAAGAVIAHEQEHVTNNAARAERQGMKATSTVTIHTDICPDCGRPFVSGGTTMTTYTRAAGPARDQSKGQFINASA